MVTSDREQQKRNEVMTFLHEHVFDPILHSHGASDTLKKGVRFTMMRMKNLTSAQMVHYYWSAIVGTEHSTEFARQMRAEGFNRFEEIIDDFRDRFGNSWLKSQADEVSKIKAVFYRFTPHTNTLCRDLFPVSPALHSKP